MLVDSQGAICASLPKSTYLPVLRFPYTTDTDYNYIILKACKAGKWLRWKSDCPECTNPDKPGLVAHRGTRLQEVEAQGWEVKGILIYLASLEVT